MTLPCRVFFFKLLFNIAFKHHTRSDCIMAFLGLAAPAYSHLLRSIRRGGCTWLCARGCVSTHMRGDVCSEHSLRLEHTFVHRQTLYVSPDAQQRTATSQCAAVSSNRRSQECSIAGSARCMHGALRYGGLLLISLQLSRNKLHLFQVLFLLPDTCQN